MVATTASLAVLITETLPEPGFTTYAQMSGNTPVGVTVALLVGVAVAVSVAVGVVVAVAVLVAVGCSVAVMIRLCGGTKIPNGLSHRMEKPFTPTFEAMQVVVGSSAIA